MPPLPFYMQFLWELNWWCASHQVFSQKCATYLSKLKHTVFVFFMILIVGSGFRFINITGYCCTWVIKNVPKIISWMEHHLNILLHCTCIFSQEFKECVACGWPPVKLMSCARGGVTHHDNVLYHKHLRNRVPNKLVHRTYFGTPSIFEFYLFLVSQLLK